MREKETARAAGRNPRLPRVRGSIMYPDMSITMTAEEHPYIATRPDQIEFGALDLAEATGISYRRVDHYCRRGYITPDFPARGSGSNRGWTRDGMAVAIEFIEKLEAWYRACPIPGGLTSSIIGPQVREHRRAARG